MDPFTTGALILGGGTLLSSIFGAGASKSAADTSAAGAREATQAQLQMFGQAREDLAPWREAGGRAVNYLEQLIKAGPGGRISTSRGTPYGPPGATTPPGMTVSYAPRNELISMVPGPSGMWEPSPPTEFIDLSKTPGGLPPETVPDYGDYMEYYNAGMMGGEGASSIPPLNYNQWRAQKFRQTPQAPSSTPTSYLPSISQEPMDWAQDYGDWAGRYKESPYYNFLLERGTQALERGAAARGRQFSGAENKALLEYGQNLASTDYDNWLKRWYQSLAPFQSLAGLGQTSAGQTASAGMQTGQNLGYNARYAGEAQAAGTLGMTRSLTQPLQWGTNQLANYYLGQANNPGMSSMVSPTNSLADRYGVSLMLGGL